MSAPGWYRRRRALIRVGRIAAGLLLWCAGWVTLQIGLEQWEIPFSRASMATVMKGAAFVALGALIGVWAYRIAFGPPPSMRDDLAERQAIRNMKTDEERRSDVVGYWLMAGTCAALLGALLLRLNA